MEASKTYESIISYNEFTAAWKRIQIITYYSFGKFWANDLLIIYIVGAYTQYTETK